MGLEVIHARADAAEIDALPDAAAIFICRMHESGEPFIAKTKRLRTRIVRLLSGENAGTKRLDLAGKVASIEYVRVFSDFEARWTFYQVLRSEYPRGYRRKLRMRAAPVVRIGMQNEFPRAAVTRRIGELDSRTFCYGPFASRKSAEESLHAALDQFLVRRCVPDLVPDIAHPGCIYGEMKMCSAPCQKRVTNDEYRVEIDRFSAFLGTHGESLLNEISSERERASSAMDFERASAVHAKWTKVRTAAQTIPDPVRRLEQWDAVMLQAGSRSDSLRVWSVKACAIAGPVEIDLTQTKAEGLKVLGTAVRDVCAAIDVPMMAPRERAEHLALLQKWIYRSAKTRVGELVQADHDGAISLRRLANAAERMLNPKVETTEVASDDPGVSSAI